MTVRARFRSDSAFPGAVEERTHSGDASSHYHYVLLDAAIVSECARPSRAAYSLQAPQHERNGLEDCEDVSVRC